MRARARGETLGLGLYTRGRDFRARALHED